MNLERKLQMAHMEEEIRVFLLGNGELYGNMKENHYSYYCGWFYCCFKLYRK